MKKILLFIISMLFIFSMIPTNIIFAAELPIKYSDTGIGEEFDQVTYVSTDMNGNSITKLSVNSWRNVTIYAEYNLKEQLIYNGTSTGINVESIGMDKAILIRPATLISEGSVKIYFTSKDGGDKRCETLTIPKIQYKDTTTTLQLSSDKDTYLMDADKNSIDVNIGASAFVNPKSNNFVMDFVFGLTARITSLEINGVEVASAYKSPSTFDDNYYGATSSNVFQIETGLKSLNIKRSQLKEGNNTITLKGYASMNTFDNFNYTVRGSKTFTINISGTKVGGVK